MEQKRNYDASFLLITSTSNFHHMIQVKVRYVLPKLGKRSIYSIESTLTNTL